MNIRVGNNPTDFIVDKRSQSETINYTATEPCFFYAFGIYSSVRIVKVNGVPVEITDSYGSSTFFTVATGFLKTGDILTSTASIRYAITKLRKLT